MPPKSVLIALAIGVSVFVGSTFAINRLRVDPEPEAEAPAAEPARPAPEKKVAPPAPKKAAPPEPEQPRQPLVLARWAVPKLTGEDAKVPFASYDWYPSGIAVDNAGSRVMVPNRKAVDVWRVGQTVPLRVQPKKLHEVYVAPDAARMYLVAGGEPKELLTHDSDGKLVGSWTPPLGPKNWHGFHDAGFDPTTSKFHISVHRSTEAPKGNFYTVQFFEVYSVSPVTGQGTMVARLDSTQFIYNRSYAPHPHTGGLFVNISGFGDIEYTAGLHRVTGGVVRKADRLPLSATPNRPVVSADGRRVADSTEGNWKLRVFDTRDGRTLFGWEKEYYQSSAWRFVGDRLAIYATSSYGVMTIGIGSAGGPKALPPLLQMYDLATGKLLGQLNPRALKLPEGVFAFSPDGTKLALASEKEVVVLDATVVFDLGR
jgi:hypothetical protein